MYAFNRALILKLFLAIIIMLIATLFYLIQLKSKHNYEVATLKPALLVISTTGRVQSTKIVKIQSRITGVLVDIKKKEGDYIKAGEPLAIMNDSLETESIAQEKAKWDSARFSLTERERAYRRSKELYQKKVISSEAFEKAEIDYLKLKQKIIELEAAFKAAIKKKQEYTIYAPLDGVVSKQSLEIGQTLDPQKILFEIIDLEAIEIGADVDECFVDYLKIGKKSILKKYNINHEPFEGQIVFVSPTVNKDTGSISIRISSPHEQTLKPGQILDISIIAEEFQKVISVPRTALIKEQEKSYVDLVLNKKIYRKEIFYIDWPSPKVIVLKGLNPGDKFLTKKSSLYDLGNIRDEF